MKRFAAISIAAILLTAIALAQTQQKPASKSAPQTKEKDAAKTPSQQPTKPQPNKEDDVQTIDDTVKIGADLVNLFFTAVDKNNHVINDLRENEVTILEDGQPQQVFTF